MKGKFYTLVIIGINILIASAPAQVSATFPQRYLSAVPFDLSPGLRLSHNSPKLIREELLDTNTVLSIAKSVGMTNQQLTGICIAPGLGEGEVWFYLLQDDAQEAYRRIGERLRSYVNARLDGHTRGCLYAAITNVSKIDSVSNAKLQTLLQYEPMLPPSWLVQEGEGSRTNKTGELLSLWASFYLVDDGIAWRYTINFNTAGGFLGIDESKFDAIELDSKFTNVINEVESEVSDEMKLQGVDGRLGSIHTFWSLKKAKLKSRGVAWRSPQDLNPGGHFD